MTRDPSPPSVWRLPAALCGLFLALACGLALRDLAMRLPFEQWRAAFLAPDVSNVPQMLVHFTVLPRMVVAVLCGAGLALAGVVCQQVLRNPLAEPTTLGVSAGASLALSAAILWAPWLFVLGREGVAILGSAVALLLVFALSWSRALSPVAMVLGGLIVTLYAGAVSSAIGLFNHDYLIGLFLWGAGFLTQQDWSGVQFLLPRMAVAVILVALMIRPLTILGLDDAAARNLGLGLSWTRFAALAVAIALSAAIVSVAGVIGFVGLAAPALVALAGARRFRDKLIWAPLCGAGLLWLTDGLVLLIPTGYREIPTGAATALLGAPILLLLLPRLRHANLQRSADGFAAPRTRRPWALLLAAALGLTVLVVAALAFAYGPYGWNWASAGQFREMLPFRWPRTIAALCAGACLAAAGTLMQRMMGNPMAAPEVLGISSGAALGVIVSLFLADAPSRPLQLGAGAAGAFVVLLGILLLGRRAAFSPDRLLLAGVATSAAFGAIVAIAMGTGDPRVGVLLTWLAGSTYHVGEAEAALIAGLTLLFLAATPLLARWLDILPLGEATARAMGVSVTKARLAVMLATAALTATATLVVGPLSFVGLMAPHMARLIGLHRGLHQLIGAVLLGGAVMTLADWCGRTWIYPYQLPAGLVATLLGGPYLMWLLRRR